MLGSLMTLAPGSLTSSPSSARSSGRFWLSDRWSGKLARMRPASEMSLVPTEIPAGRVNARMIGRNDALANSGASSTLV